MNSHAHIKSLIGSLSTQLSAPAVSSENEQGDILIDLDERQYKISLSQDEHDLLVHAPIAPLPEGEARLNIMRELLASNYSWGVTSGGVLGINSDEGWVFMVRRFALGNMDENAFVNKFGLLRCQIKYWNNLISHLQNESNKGSAYWQN